MGKQRPFDPEIAEELCIALAGSDKGLRKLLASDDRFPPVEAVFEWAQNDAQFAQQFARAKRQQLEMMAEDIVDISMDDNLDPNDKRIRIDTRKWLLSKLIPRTYGDKLDITSDGEKLATPSHVIDQRVQSIIMAARVRKGLVAIEGLDDNALKLLA